MAKKDAIWKIRVAPFKYFQFNFVFRILFVNWYSVTENAISFIFMVKVTNWYFFLEVIKAKLIGWKFYVTENLKYLNFYLKYYSYFIFRNKKFILREIRYYSSCSSSILTISCLKFIEKVITSNNSKCRDQMFPYLFLSKTTLLFLLLLVAFLLLHFCHTPKTHHLQHSSLDPLEFLVNPWGLTWTTWEIIGLGDIHPSSFVSPNNCYSPTTVSQSCSFYL